MEAVRAFIKDAHRAVQRQLEPMEAEDAWKQPLRRRRGRKKDSQRNPQQDAELLRRYLDVVQKEVKSAPRMIAEEMTRDRPHDFPIEGKSLETHIRRLIKRWEREYAAALASTNALRPFMILRKQVAD